MKKSLILIMILLLSFNLIGCSSDDVVQKNEFVEKVKTLETNRIKLFNLEINYATFKENVSGIMTTDYEKNYFKEMDEKVIFGYDGEQYRGKDLENLTEEELSQHKENLKEYTQDYGVKIKKMTLEISDGSYEGTFDDQKRVYSKQKQTAIVSPDSQKTMEALTLKKYDFDKENEEWRIAGIDTSFFRLDGSEEVKQMIEEKTNDRSIDYIESMTFNFDEE